MHTLRSAPCFGHPALHEVDSLLRRSLCDVINIDLTDLQWQQASLPVRLGGLGIRLVSQLAPSAFLASAVGTKELQDAILGLCCPSESSIVLPRKPGHPCRVILSLLLPNPYIGNQAGTALSSSRAITLC